ncbi:MAG: nuclear transport factor 2 family protein [Draconibacterium sp.]|nr:nuclear transport factor 2 family protein [Draconibacterium sp.]
MRVLFTVVFTAILFFSTMAENKISKKEKAEINNLLDKQLAAWNAGNLEKFMETYRKSDKLVFVGSRGPTYGWQATLDNYKKGYPDKNAMGELKFTIFDISKIDKKTVFVIGKFELVREMGDLSGYFTLAIQKIKNEWLIVSDHSSSEG